MLHDDLNFSTDALHSEACLIIISTLFDFLICSQFLPNSIRTFLLNQQLFTFVYNTIPTSSVINLRFALERN